MLDLAPFRAWLAETRSASTARVYTVNVKPFLISGLEIDAYVETLEGPRGTRLVREAAARAYIAFQAGSATPREPAAHRAPRPEALAEADRLRGWLRWYLRNLPREDREDVTQEVLLFLWQYPPPEDMDLARAVFWTARNRVAAFYQARHRLACGKASEPLPHSLNVGPARVLASQALEAARDLRDLERECLLLGAIGLNAVECAEVLGIKEHRAQINLRFARKRMTGWLKTGTLPQISRKDRTVATLKDVWPS